MWGAFRSTENFETRTNGTEISRESFQKIWKFLKFWEESQLERKFRVRNRPFPHSTSVRSNNSTRARFEWTFSYICCIFVHPDLDSAPLFVGMRERSISETFGLPRHALFSGIPKNAVPFVTGNFRKFRPEFFIVWRFTRNISFWWRSQQRSVWLLLCRFEFLCVSSIQSERLRGCL